jgi:hypothetical protein
MQILTRHLFPVAAAIGTFFVNPVFAQTLISIQAVPSAWLIQNYVPNNTDLFYTGSSCLNGQLIFPSTAVQADQDRLWALILTAKSSGQQVLLYYYVTGGNCYISSFGLVN